MPSDTVPASRLDRVRATLDATLSPVLPETWRTVPHISAPPAQQLTPILYTEFTGISNSHGGVTLPQGLVFCDFDLVIVTALTDDEKGEDDVDAIVLDLIVALDASESLAWESAKKERLATGQFAWRITLAVTTHTNI